MKLQKDSIWSNISWVFTNNFRMSYCLRGKVF